VSPAAPRHANSASGQIKASGLTSDAEPFSSSLAEIERQGLIKSLECSLQHAKNELIKQHLLQDQERERLIEEGKQAERKQGQQYHDLLRSVEQERIGSHQMRQDMQTLINTVKDFDELREKLRGTQINIENEKKDCKTCHPW